MVLRIWLAIGLAAIVAVITIFMGIINQARFTVILYRTLISIGIFASFGYVMGVVGEKFFLSYVKKALESEKLSDEKNEEFIQNETNEANISGDSLDSLKEEQKEADFAPFTTDNFKRVVSPPNS